MCSRDLSETRLQWHRVNRQTASNLSMSTPTRMPGAKRQAYDIIVICQHVVPSRDDDLSCIIDAAGKSVMWSGLRIPNPNPNRKVINCKDFRK